MYCRQTGSGPQWLGSSEVLRLLQPRSLVGVDGLFNDSFAGGPGFCVYEEMPYSRPQVRNHGARTRGADRRAVAGLWLLNAVAPDLYGLCSNDLSSRGYPVSRRRYTGVEETRQQLPSLLERAHAGEPVVITKRGKPFAADDAADWIDRTRDER